MISLSQLRVVLGEFLDQQVVSAAPSSLIKWTLGGASVLILNNIEQVIAPYKPLLVSLGIMDDALNTDKKACSAFLDNAFQTSPELKVTFLGSIFTFTKADADVLLSIMEKHDGV